MTSDLELRTLEEVQWFRVTNPHGHVYLRVGERLLQLQLKQDVGIRLKGNFVHHSGEAVLDYRALEDLSPAERARLGWEHKPVPARTQALPPHTPVQPLPPAVVERLSRLGEPIDLVRSELLYRRDAPEHDELYLILEGCVEEWRGPTWLGQLTPGCLVGELGVLEDRRARRVCEARAREDSRLVRLKWTTVASQLTTAERKAISTHALRHGASWCRQGVEEHDMATQQAFSDAMAHYVPGPYVGQAKLWAVPLARPVDGHLRYRMPPRLDWHPSLPFCMLLVSEFESFKPSWADPDDPGISYTESGLFVPTLLTRDGKVEPRAYFPWLYPSNIMATIVGRELYGYPKAYANTRVERDRLVLRLGDHTAFDLRIRQLEGLEHRLLATAAPDLLRAFSPDFTDRETWTQRPSRDLRWELGAGRVPPRPRELLNGALKAALGLPGFLASFQRSFLTEIPQVGWRRRYAPDLSERAATDQHRWSPSDFAHDELVGTRFKWNPELPARQRLPAFWNSQRYFQLTEGQEEIVLDMPGDRPRAFRTLGGLGIFAELNLEMAVEGTPTGVLVDYLDPALGLTDAEKQRLAVGPRARRRLGD